MRRQGINAVVGNGSVEAVIGDLVSAMALKILRQEQATQVDSSVSMHNDMIVMAGVSNRSLVVAIRDHEPERCFRTQIRFNFQHIRSPHILCPSQMGKG